jgi:serine/threonine protein kinase
MPNKLFILKSSQSNYFFKKESTFLKVLIKNLSSRNLFLDKMSSIKLADISLVKEFNLANASTKSIHYISPELVNGLNYSDNADTWSLGCVLYELLTLKKLFNGKNEYEILQDIQNKQLSDIHIEIASPNEKLNFILRHALERDKWKRFSCAEILDSLFEHVILL